MTERQSNILSVTIVLIGLFAFTIFNVFVTKMLLCTSEEELFANLVATFKIFANFHTSIAAMIALFCCSILWIAWLTSVVFCITSAVRWFKEKRNDS
jgi:hypothetical protein